MATLLCAAQSVGRDHGVHGSAEQPPRFDLVGELAAAGGGELVKARAAIVLGRSPRCLEPPTLHESMQRRIERSLVHLEHAFRDLADALAQAPPVHWLEQCGFENEQVERALEDVGVALHVWRELGRALGRSVRSHDVRQESATILVECQGERAGLLPTMAVGTKPRRSRSKKGRSLRAKYFIRCSAQFPCTSSVQFVVKIP